MHVVAIILVMLCGGLTAAELSVVKKLDMGGAQVLRSLSGKKERKSVVIKEDLNKIYTIPALDVLTAEAGSTRNFYLSTPCGMREIGIVGGSRTCLSAWCDKLQSDLEHQQLHSEVAIPWKSLATIPTAWALYRPLMMYAKFFALGSMTKSLWDARQAKLTYRYLKQFDITERLATLVADEAGAENQLGFVQKTLAEGARAYASPRVLVRDQDFVLRNHHGVPEVESEYRMVFVDDFVPTPRATLIDTMKTKLWDKIA